MSRIEKIEIRSSEKKFIYTGTVSEDEHGNVEVNTVRGETFIFRKEQVEFRRVLNQEEMDRIENGND